MSAESEDEQTNNKNPIQAEGPQIKKERADVVSDQDEVDEFVIQSGFLRGAPYEFGSGSGNS